jgi:hypothetical protein
LRKTCTSNKDQSVCNAELHDFSSSEIRHSAFKLGAWQI